MTYRTKIAVLVGMFILAFAVPQVAPSSVTPQVVQTAVAQAAPPHWVLSYQGGQITDQQANGPACPLPCQVTGKVTDANGQQIASVDWYEGQNISTSTKHPSSGAPEWSASWAYNTAGGRSFRVVVTYADGSPTYYGGGNLDVTDPSDIGTSVTYVGPDTLYQRDDNRNTFRVDFTGTTLDIVVRDAHDKEYSPQKLGETTDGNGHHAVFRLNDAKPGPAQIDMKSGDARVFQNVNIVGDAAYRWSVPTLKLRKATGGRCMVQVRSTGFSSAGAKSVTRLKFDRKVGRTYRKVRSAKRTRTVAAAGASHTTTVVSVTFTNTQIKKMPKVRATLSQNITGGGVTEFTYGPASSTLNLAACR